MSLWGQGDHSLIQKMGTDKILLNFSSILAPPRSVASFFGLARLARKCDDFRPKYDRLLIYEENSNNRYVIPSDFYYRSGVNILSN